MKENTRLVDPGEEYLKWARVSIELLSGRKSEENEYVVRIVTPEEWEERRQAVRRETEIASFQRAVKRMLDEGFAEAEIITIFTAALSTIEPEPEEVS
jgi:hypothetical protein